MVRLLLDDLPGPLPGLKFCAHVLLLTACTDLVHDVAHVHDSVYDTFPSAHVASLRPVDPLCHNPRNCYPTRPLLIRSLLPDCIRLGTSHASPLQHNPTASCSITLNGDDVSVSLDQRTQAYSRSSMTLQFLCFQLNYIRLSRHKEQLVLADCLTASWSLAQAANKYMFCIRCTTL